MPTPVYTAHVASGNALAGAWGLQSPDRIRTLCLHATEMAMAVTSALKEADHTAPADQGS